MKTRPRWPSHMPIENCKLVVSKVEPSKMGNLRRTPYGGKSEEAHPPEADRLMARFQSRLDADAFEQIASSYMSPALAVARQILSDHALAEDAVQESFLRVIRKREQYIPGSPFSCWFYAIVRNVCVDMLRKRARQTKVIEETAAGGEGSRPPLSRGRACPSGGTPPCGNPNRGFENRDVFNSEIATRNVPRGSAILAEVSWAGSPCHKTMDDEGWTKDDRWTDLPASVSHPASSGPAAPTCVGRRRGRRRQERGSSRSELPKLLDVLTSGERDVLVLRIVEGLGFRDVAAALGISEEAAKKRAQRALRRLRAKICDSQSPPGKLSVAL